jgi:hydroxyethylthiazole kinase-like uncharacterized protein yjeF
MATAPVGSTQSPRPPGAAGPWRVTGGQGPWPLCLAAQAREAEARALAGAPSPTLMARAGLGVARLAVALAPQARRIAVLAGPGNNGGDGLVAARLLHAAGLGVSVWRLPSRDRPPPDAAWALAEAQLAGVPLHHLDALDSTAGVPDLAIDALLGLGARQPPAGPLASGIARLNAWHRAGVQVLAVDLPSGLNPDTGQPLGEAVVRADDTLALLSLTPGCFTAHGRDLAGTMWFDDLGAAPLPALTTPWTLSGAPADRAAPHAAHKGSRGDVVVIGGAPGMVGAAWLAARAALAAGAGRVFMSPLSQADALDAGRPELMRLARAWEQPALHLAGRTVVCGCGGGDAVREVLPAVLGHATRLVLDADALNAIAGDDTLRALLRARSARGRPTVLTPHPLEAARLLGSRSAEVQASRLEAARALAASTDATVVLKGSGTVTAAATGEGFVNPTGNAALATAGSGDVLAGWLAGEWAANTEEDPVRLAAAAVWRHGHAADRHRDRGRVGPLLAADLIGAMAQP